MKIMMTFLTLLLTANLSLTPNPVVNSLKDALKTLNITLIEMKDEEDAINHLGELPEDYLSPSMPDYDLVGKQLGYPANTLYIDGIEFSTNDIRDTYLIEYDGRFDDEFEDEEDKPKKVVDYDLLTEVLDANEVAYVGQNGMNAFFGHYYDLSGTGVFNPITQYDILHEDSEVVITDENGYSRGYLITDMLNILHPEQSRHFYNEEHIPSLAYYGNGDDMVYIQYCRWDIELGLLISAIGYRVW